jgi:hypothetical protein
VQGRRSRAQRSDERWAMDLTHVPCGVDGWGHLSAIIDCRDREVTGYEFALRGRAERALEEAFLARFRTLRPYGPTPVVRSDMAWFFKAGVFAPPVAIPVCARSSSRLIHPSKTASSNASFVVSKKSVFGSVTSAGVDPFSWTVLGIKEEGVSNAAKPSTISRGIPPADH